MALSAQKIVDSLPVQGDSLSLVAYQRIREDLMGGRFAPGEKLKHRDLAARLGMSATPVREALKRLVSEAVLTQADHHSVRLPVLTPERYLEICELRVDLEGKAAAVAAERATPVDLEELRGIQSTLDAAVRQGRLSEWLLQNERFHLAICRCARMPVLLRLVEILWLQAGPVVNALRGNPKRRGTREHPHWQIIAALEERNALLARALLADDIMRIARDLLPGVQARAAQQDR
ncbi:MAG: GntR family transcriptional regulator [Betaproteobacteria bacterium]|nr:GntR family transcriptional regulator [Betaproteobacteria bacterium]